MGLFSPIKSIDARQAAERHASAETALLDVRQEFEWKQGHIAGAFHIPLAQVSHRAHVLPAGKTVIHATLDPNDINKDLASQYALVGDADLVLSALLDAIGGKPRGRLQEVTAEIAHVRVPAQLHNDASARQRCEVRRHQHRGAPKEGKR